MCPSLAPPVFEGTIRTSSSPRSSALNEHPTPQYAQVVSTLRVGTPSSMTVFSCSVAVGQACTQAPHDTQSESMNPTSAPAATLEAKPRPSMVRAKVPCTSSHARTQREHTMHLEASKVKYGLEVSLGASRWLVPASTPEP